MANNPEIKATIKSNGKEIKVYYVFNGSSIHSGKYIDCNNPNSIYTKEELILKK